MTIFLCFIYFRILCYQTKGLSRLLVKEDISLASWDGEKREGVAVVICSKTRMRALMPHNIRYYILRASQETNTSITLPRGICRCAQSSRLWVCIFWCLGTLQRGLAYANFLIKSKKYCRIRKDNICISTQWIGKIFCVLNNFAPGSFPMKGQVACGIKFDFCSRVLQVWILLLICNSDHFFLSFPHLKMEWWPEQQ